MLICNLLNDSSRLFYLYKDIKNIIKLVECAKKKLQHKFVKNSKIGQDQLRLVAPYPIYGRIFDKIRFNTTFLPRLV